MLFRSALFRPQNHLCTPSLSRVTTSMVLIVSKHGNVGTQRPDTFINQGGTLTAQPCSEHAHIITRSFYLSLISTRSGDGIVGPLIVHSPNDPLKRGNDYEIDQLLFIKDHLHSMSTDVVSGILSQAGFEGVRCALWFTSALRTDR